MIVDRVLALAFADYAQAAEYPEHLEQPKELEDAKSLEVRDVTVLWAGVGGVHALYYVEGRDGHEVDEEHAPQVAPEDHLFVNHPLSVLALEWEKTDDEHIEHEGEVDVLVDPEEYLDVRPSLAVHERDLVRRDEARDHQEHERVQVPVLDVSVSRVKHRPTSVPERVVRGEHRAHPRLRELALGG